MAGSAESVNDVIPPKPIPLDVIFENLPNELKAIPHWVVWKYKRNGKNWTKPLYQLNGVCASTKDPATWSTYEAVKAAYEAGGWDGIGFCLTDAQGIIGIDLDDVLINGQLEEPATRTIEKINSYTEISPSGEGIRIFLKGTYNGDNKKEVYTNRYLTLTGHIYDCRNKIEYRTDELNAIYGHKEEDEPVDEKEEKEREHVHREKRGEGEEKEGKKVNREKEGEEPLNEADDSDIIRIAETLKGDKFKQLMAGNWAGLGYPSSSEARMALYDYLAYFCHDKDQIARIFKMSGLYRADPKKCDRLMDSEIRKAMKDCKGHYQPKNRAIKEIIQINNRSLDEVVMEAIDAINVYNLPPKIFVRGGRLCKVVRNDHNIPSVKELDRDAIALLMSRAAKFVRVKWAEDEDGNRLKKRAPVFPPKQVIGAVYSFDEWPYPKLESVIATPIVRPDGSICTEPGFDHKTGIYYDGNLKLDIPEKPTKEDAEKAAKFVLDEVYADFPFEDDASKAAALAGLLVLIIRPMIPGPTPMMLVNKPDVGIGASLLMDVTSLIAFGMSCSFTHWTNSDEETRKNITAMLRKGKQMICFDNIDGQLKSSALSETLTAETWQDRILGLSEEVTLPQHSCWFATGNNVSLAGDLPRRIIPCNLYAPQAKSWMRPIDKFRHPQLKAWVLDHRKELLEKLYIMVRAWIVAGRPKGNYGKLIGSFEEWTPIMDGILSYAGITDFLKNASRFYETEDTDTLEWLPLLVKVYDRFVNDIERNKKKVKDAEFTISDIKNELEKRRLKEEDLPTEMRDMMMISPHGVVQFKSGFNNALGKGLKHIIGKRFNIPEEKDDEGQVLNKDKAGMDIMLQKGKKDSHRNANKYVLKLIERSQNML